MVGIRKKKVGHLKDLLNAYQLFSEESLKQFIKGKTEIEHGQVTFNVMRPADLNLDDEQRSYLDKFEFRETIFDCERINLRNSSRVKLTDCLVIGTLLVGDKPDGETTIELDTVAVTGKLIVTGRGAPMASVSLVSVQASSLRLFNFSSDLNLMDSRFASTEMRLLSGESLAMIGNELGALSIAECDFQKVRFPSRQVRLKYVNASRLMNWLSNLIFNPLKFVVGSQAVERAFYSASRQDAKLREIDTLKFLFENSEISHSKRDAAELKYLRSLAESSSWISRFFVFATGGVIKPWRIVILAAAVIFGFAGIYWRNASSFTDTNQVCSYWDALYFSGLTFTTIGYGDITPTHWMRGLAVLEGLLGIALGVAFLVSLTRRYIE